MPDALQRTPLFHEHVKLGARIVPFAGFEMPVQYTGVREEHFATRKHAGLFDVSHMGEFIFQGKDAEAALNWVVTNDVSALKVGAALYTVMCLEDGGIVDDLIIYRQAPDRFLVIVNAGNIAGDLAWMIAQCKGFKNLEIRDESAAWGLIALQGPKAQAVAQRLFPTCNSELQRFHFIETQYRDRKITIARTGYTGEDGFELLVAASDAPALWSELLKVGAEFGLTACGLGARDTLRLEMNYPLYGHDINVTTNPIEAGLGWVVKLKKPNFVGKAALVEAKASPGRARAGFAMTERAIPREGYKLLDPNGKEVGTVTSGTHSPSLDKGIGVGYLPRSLATEGQVLFVEIRGARKSAVVVSTPFYRPTES